MGKKKKDEINVIKVPPPPIPAGLGYSHVIADMDFETYSPAGFVLDPQTGCYGSLPGADEKGISVVGAAAYTEHPDAEVLSLAYDLKDGLGARHWAPNLPTVVYGISNKLPYDLIQYLKYGGLIEAWNASFEYYVWNNICVPKYDFPPLQFSQMRCAAAKARAFALPGKLEKAGEVLDLKLKKDKEGEKLIKLFCVPHDFTKNPKGRIFMEDDPENAEKFISYNIRDIQAEAEASSLVPDLNDDELEYWQMDQAINQRGVQIDLESVKSCIAIIEQVYKKYDAQLYQLTNGMVPAASQLPKLKAWLLSQGFPFPSLTEKILEEALKSVLPPLIIQVLQIRAIASSASIKKVYSMLNRASKDGRLRDLYIYHSARTGRAAGVGPQPQNLPKAGPTVYYCTCGKCHATHSACPWCGKEIDINTYSEWNSKAAEDALEIISSKRLSLLEYYFDDAFYALSGCLRGLFVAKPGHELICSDYRSIEAVVLAALAGEKWRLDVFNTHGKIYEMAASLVTGMPFEEYLSYYKQHGKHHPSRATVGKLVELAFGFGGGVKAGERFGMDKYYTKEQINDFKFKWRKANPAIVEFWGGQYRRGKREMFGLEGMAINAVLNPGQEFSFRGITYKVYKNILYCKLLSGRYLTYHSPQLHEGMYEGSYQLSYMGWNTNPGNGGINTWMRMYLYGGKHCENIVQATSRDIFMFGIKNLERGGYPVVLHTHDEPVSEIPIGFGSIEEFEKLMTTPPLFAIGWPIKAGDSWRGHRYRKD